ncbi:MAG TPA: helix-turn-helix domain-containing protein [Sphingobium sp.]
MAKCSSSAKGDAHLEPPARDTGKPVEIERPSLRERNKTRKETAIREAARRLFVERGYQATTLREVAEEADVGFGTVSAYAADKSGLLAMVFVEELKSLPALFARTSQSKDPLDELLVGLGKLYAFWGKIPALSQHVLQQMEFFAGNPHMDLIVARRSHSRLELTEWIKRLQDEGKIIADADPEDAADTLFAIYTSAVREWSATTPTEVAVGVKRLRRLMKLPMAALTGMASYGDRTR